MLTLTLLMVVGGCATTPSEPAPERDPSVRTIAFSSCYHGKPDTFIWHSIAAEDPDLFLFIGDNVYVDLPRPPKGEADFQRTYDELANNRSWQHLLERVPVLATWDDHDYGLNDAGVEFPLKQVAQQQFIDFFGLPEDSPVRQRPGVYDAHVFGPEGKRVQVILLDTRYFRDPILKNPKGRVDGKGPYMPRTDGEGTMLGEAQWAWLEEQLRQPADLRIIASSIQVVADEHGWESWGNLPHERNRLYKLIKTTGANGVVFISGDRHLTEVSRDDDPTLAYPVWDFTNSGMDEKEKAVREPNRSRVKGPVRRENYGVFTIDWAGPAGPSLQYRSCTQSGSPIFEQRIWLKDLRAESP